MPEASSSTSFSSQTVVKIEGVELADPVARALGPSWVESSVNLPGAFHLAFRRSAKFLAAQAPMLLSIGAKVEVYAVADGQGKDIPLITGLVTAIEAEYEHGLPGTVVRGFDYSFKMLRHRRATGYYNKTVAEIVKELAALDGVDVEVIEPTLASYRLITQPNISDWQFVQYLADISDMQVDFSREGLLRFRNPTPAVSAEVAGSSALNPHILEFDSNMLRCRTGVTASDQVTEVTSLGWNEFGCKAYPGRAPAVKSPGIDIGTTPEMVASAFGPATLTETGTPYLGQTETDHAATSLAADITSAFAELEVQVNGQPALVPGLVVELKDAGTPFDGTYTVTATRHEFDGDNNYTTWVWVTGRQVRTLYGLASSGNQPVPRIHGVVNAIVDDIRDPANQGRVKLRFPWFSDTYKTDWVRTVQFGGHKGGGVISPEVDDEVLVAFDRGIMDYPYVLGGLYSNSENAPSPHEVRNLQTDGRLNRRSLVSRSGQRLELLDAVAENKTGVRLLSADNKLTVFLDEANTKITISSDGENGTVDITSTERITLTGSYVNISGDFVNIKGTTTITGALTQIGDAEMNGAVNINGVTQMDGAVNITGDVAIGGGENVAGVILQDGSPVV